MAVDDSGHLDRARIEVVAKLMAKAVSTVHGPEAVALVERSYGLLAQVLSDFDESAAGVAGGGRRRERRLIRDRRRARRDRLSEYGSPGGAHASATGGTERYLEVARGTATRRDERCSTTLSL